MKLIMTDRPVDLSFLKDEAVNTLICHPCG